MFIPVVGVAALLSMLSSSNRTLSREVRKRALAEGWLGLSDTGHLRVPRLWFEVPGVVQAPFVWPSSRSVGIVQHPWRTVQIFLSTTNFLNLASSPRYTLTHQKAFMEENYLHIGQRMVSGEIPPGFPPPWLSIRYNSDGDPVVTGHEGRHRALMAEALGLDVIPVHLQIQFSPEGYEHQRNTIEMDPVVERVTRGAQVHIRSEQHHMNPHAPPSRWMFLTPMTPDGKKLSHELVRLKMSLR